MSDELLTQHEPDFDTASNDVFASWCEELAAACKYGTHEQATLNEAAARIRALTESEKFEKDIADRACAENVEHEATIEGLQSDLADARADAVKLVLDRKVQLTIEEHGLEPTLREMIYHYYASCGMGTTKSRRYTADFIAALAPTPSSVESSGEGHA